MEQIRESAAKGDFPFRKGDGMRGQFFIFAAVIVVLTVAWVLQSYGYSLDYGRAEASDSSTIAQNIAAELAYAAAISPANVSERVSDFVSFAQEYAAERNFELNVTGGG
jgi:hypothetical protein